MSGNLTSYKDRCNGMITISSTKEKEREVKELEYKKQNIIRKKRLQQLKAQENRELESKAKEEIKKRITEKKQKTKKNVFECLEEEISELKNKRHTKEYYIDGKKVPTKEVLNIFNVSDSYLRKKAKGYKKVRINGQVLEIKLMPKYNVLVKKLYNPYGKLVGKNLTTQQASEIIGISATYIRQLMRENAKTYKGFTFEYESMKGHVDGSKFEVTYLEEIDTKKQTTTVRNLIVNGEPIKTKEYLESIGMNRGHFNRIKTGWQKFKIKKDIVEVVYKTSKNVILVTLSDDTGVIFKEVSPNVISKFLGCCPTQIWSLKQKKKTEYKGYTLKYRDLREEV